MLAAAIGVSYQQLQKYETGASSITIGRLLQFAAALEVEVSYFLDGLSPSADAEPPEPVSAGRGRATIELAQNFDTLEDTQVRQAVSMLIRTLAQAEAEGQDAAAAE